MIVVLLLAAVLLYFGVAVQTFFDLLLDRRVRRSHHGWRISVMLVKCLVWPLILLDVVRLDGLMTRGEAAQVNADLVAAATPVSANFDEARRVEMLRMRDSLRTPGKNRDKRRRQKKKRNKKR